jgi:hypothetical protein
MDRLRCRGRLRIGNRDRRMNRGIPKRSAGTDIAGNGDLIAATRSRLLNIPR